MQCLLNLAFWEPPVDLELAPSNWFWIINSLLSPKKWCDQTPQCWYVYKNERRMDRFSTQQERNCDKTVQVVKQGFLYTAAFLVITIPLLINEKTPLPTGYHVFHACLFPLEGGFNCSIYFKPRVDAIKKTERTSLGTSIMIGRFEIDLQLKTV